MEIILALIYLLLPVLLGYFLYKSNHNNKKNLIKINQLYKDFKEKEEELKLKIKIISILEKELKELQGYSKIVDIENEISHLKELSEEDLSKAKQKLKTINSKIEEELKSANDIANKIQLDAEKKAKEIAGNAYIAKENAEQYEATVKAMKNIIKGYGDEYLIPNRNVLDELAAEYDHKEAGKKLAEQRKLIKSMMKNNTAADCDYVEAYRRSTAIDFALDAYNGKVDTILSKVKHDNYGKLLQQLEDAFRLVNHNGKAFKNARIETMYHSAIVEMLKLAVATQELKCIDQEEQRAIKEQIREEEKARREYEKAIKEAEKEEKILQKAMKEARKQLEQANSEEKAEFELKLKELEEKLLTAEERGKRAISMAQMTKTGHVYVISNIGSFGENIYKIGMTRRLEPLDRVKELGDASVPFSFDVHAMINSENAPALEKQLHKIFENNQVNKVNHRKEFFDVEIDKIKEVIVSNGYDTHWTMKAEALEYHQSKAIKEKKIEAIKLLKGIK